MAFQVVAVGRNRRRDVAALRATIRDAAPTDSIGAALATPFDRARFWQPVLEPMTMADLVGADMLARNERRRAEGGEA